MIDWTSPEELQFFQLGMVWSITCCQTQMYFYLHPEPLLAWGRWELARHTDIPPPETKCYRAYLTAWLEGAWAYIYHPREGEVRLRALAGQIEYQQRKREGRPLDVAAIVQASAISLNSEERAAFRGGVQAAAEGRREEAFWEYSPRPSDYNRLLDSLEVDSEQ